MTHLTLKNRALRFTLRNPAKTGAMLGAAVCAVLAAGEYVFSASQHPALWVGNAIIFAIGALALFSMGGKR